MPLPDSVTIEAPEVVPEISNVPLSTTSLEPAIEPVPDSASVSPEPMEVVAPPKVFETQSVSVPVPSTVRPPLPLITPEKIVLAFVSVSVSLPKSTAPSPDSVTIEAPEVVAMTSKVPLSMTSLELAIEPNYSASVPLIVVVPL